MLVAVAAGVSASTSAMTKEPLAKDLFGAAKLPAVAKPQSFGFYSKGCFTGGVAIATDGPTWQAMRLSRNRRWGHPAMIKLIEKLSRDAVADGWPGLLLGDISQPRGGPMLTGPCLAPDRPRRRHLVHADARPPPERRKSARP